MLKNKKVTLLACLIISSIIITYSISEVVITKDGNKYIGKITEDGDKIKVATVDGELIIKRDRIKAIYKDAATIVNETNTILKEAQEIISGANKIQDPNKRNASLDNALEILRKAQDMCMDVIDVFSGKDAEAISKQFKEINGTIKHANSLKVLGNETPPPSKETPKETTQSPPKKKPDIDPEKIEAAKEFYLLGLSAFKEKQYEKARDLFTKAITYYKDFPEAYAKLGDTYGMLKEEELGYGSYQLCIEIINSLESPSEELTKLREDCLRKIEKFKLIEEKILTINKDFISRLMGLGKQCIDDEDYLLAEEVFSLILQLDKNNDDAVKYLRKVIEELNKETKNDANK
jgi:tetratricopeptide (TPR) repeat protein